MLAARVRRRMLERMQGGVTPPEPVAADTRVEDALPSDFVISDKISRQDNIPSVVRVTTGYTHVSQLIRTECMRQYILMARSTEPFTSQVNSNDRLVWAYGRAAENHVRVQYIQHFLNNPDEQTIPFGTWKCACGMTKHENVKLSRLWTKCPACGTMPHNYHEVTLLDHENRLVGNPDFILVRDGVYILVEVKSCKHESFEDYQKKGIAGREHVLQAALYRHMMLQNPKIFARVSDHILILYVNKQYKRSSPYNEMVIEASDYTVAIETELAKARTLKRALENKESTMVTDKVCSSMRDPRAATCPVATRCFNMQ